ncbi:TonB-dependent receptor [Brevundimonas subvibrioides]|uniref:TonB-dependent receptor n=1 Tax=Brevundimonas subvibrioides (strain ATCC 15264 / DSM 4735 / LMG 14903 / NBRC 16000 / CB 81) TaxID=633149 RepID=D9QIQ8_BRESC|nr:TonB-dependent receptor [Brevundimonas subvibrioides]ADL01391.1 TonB-dependent receptor [Brevundimonas subvibrioides ATCC 15264]
MRRFKAALLGASAFTAALALGQPALAQTAPQPDQDATTVDEVVVTGIRASLRNALADKRAADNVVEVLSADDIGALPEISIAESLARLPGLTSNRDRGNGTQISIRGMGPNLVNTLLNGRELVSAEASRNIRYEQFPAELINGAYVFKSPTASQVEGAIAGQVDLRTIRPLDYSDRRIVANVRGTYSDLAADIEDADPYGYIASFSYIDQFMDGKLGVAIGYSGRRQAVATARTNVFRYTNSFADLNGDGTGNDEIPFGYEALVRGGDDIRDGGLATVQYEPTENISINADLFYSKVSYDETQRGFRLEDLPFGNTFSNATVQNGGVTGLTATKAADFGLQLRNVNELFEFTDELWAGGVNGEYRGDRWTLKGDVAYSTTERDQRFITVRTEVHDIVGGVPVERQSGVTGTFNTTPGSAADYAFNVDLTNPAINLVSEFQIPENGGGAPLINDELVSGNVDFEHELDGFFTAVQVGARVTDRSKDYTQRTQFGFVDPAARRAIPTNLLNAPVRFPGDFSNVPSTLSFDILGVIDAFFGDINPTTSDFDRRSSWVVDEKTTAGYANVDFDTALFGRALTGNLGVRVIKTETTSSSTRVDQGAQTGGAVVLTPVSFTNEFTDTLPTLNLNWQIAEGQQIRLAASKGISRPPLDDLNAGFGVFVFGAPQAFGGNPELEPFRANQFDLTYERYFGPDTAFTISGFYKDLETYIVPQITEIIVDVNGTPTAGTFRQPVNGTGGYIQGFEVLYQQAFTFLPAPFDGLGVYANYSYTDSDISVAENDNAIGNIPLPGLSEHVGNLSFYYYKNGFEARIAGRYRSEFATELGDTDRILFNEAETVVDFQTSYTFPDNSSLSGVELLFQANNLTDEPFETYYGDTARQGRYETFGRRFFLGATYRFGG